MDEEMDLPESPVVPKKKRKSESVAAAASMSSSSPGSPMANQLMLTPDNVNYNCHARVNPFEPFCLRNLKSSIFSPSVFLTSTPTVKTPTGFNGWNVKEMAELFPKSLENSPSSHTNPYPVDSFEEAKAQEDITEFFNGGPIAPTPDDVTRKKMNYCIGVGIISSPVGVSAALARRKAASSSRLAAEVSDSWTNTQLSFPPGDLPAEVEWVLGRYFNMTQSCSETGDSFSSTGHLNDARFDPEELEIDECSQSSSHRFDRNVQMPVRRRLELSFGEINKSPPPRRRRSSSSEYGDPFVTSHEFISPGRTDGLMDDSSSVFELEPESQFAGQQIHLTPGCSDVDEESGRGRRRSVLSSPDITPIRRENIRQ